MFEIHSSSPFVFLCTTNEYILVPRGCPWSKRRKKKEKKRKTRKNRLEKDEHRANANGIGSAAWLRDDKSVWPTARVNEPCPVCRPLAREWLGGRESSRGWKRDRGTKSRRGKRKGERDYPDIHRTLFFILHYPCSTPLYSIMPAPRINDESYPPPALPTRTAICPSGYSSSSLCATAINTSPSAVARLSNEKSTLLYADRFIIRIKLR